MAYQLRSWDTNKVKRSAGVSHVPKYKLPTLQLRNLRNQRLTEGDGFERPTAVFAQVMGSPPRVMSSRSYEMI